MKIGIHTPSKPAVAVSLLLAILALIGHFVDSSFAFLIAMFAYIVGALGDVRFREIVLQKSANGRSTS